MASGTFILRPSADLDEVGSGNSFLTNIDAPKYSLISEEVADGDSTYLHGHDGTYYGAFRISGEIPNVEFAVKEIRITANYKIDKSGKYANNVSSSDVDISLHLNDACSSSWNLPSTDNDNMDAYASATNTVASNYSDFLKELNLGLDSDGVSFFSNIKLVLITECNKTESSKDGVSTNDFRISQIYVEVDYEEIFGFHKVSGSWRGAYETYKKENGNWVSIANEDGMNIIRSRFLLDKCKYRGHIENPIADIAPTCTETGKTDGSLCTFCGRVKYDTVIPALGHNELDYTTATCTVDGLSGGKKCSRCGVITVEPTVAQSALGHSFNSVSGKCIRCSTYSDSAISFSILRDTQTSATTFKSMPNVTWGDYANESYSSSSYESIISWVKWTVESDGSITYEYYSNIFGVQHYMFKLNDVKSMDIIVANTQYTATDIYDYRCPYV